MPLLQVPDWNEEQNGDSYLQFSSCIINTVYINSGVKTPPPQYAPTLLNHGL